MLINRFSEKIIPFAGNKNRVIKTSAIDTPIGLMYAAAIDEGVCFLDFADCKKLEKQINQLQKVFKASLENGENDHLENLHTQLGEYFERTRKMFVLPLIFSGTEFQIQAWKQLQNIPYGETRTYTQQATKIGKPKAARAVATANATNRIAIIVPCHRVIAANGGLSGYAGGLWRKEYLLKLEKNS